MGITTEDFIKGLTAALNDQGVVEAFQKSICAPLMKEIEDLRAAIHKKDEIICELQKSVQKLEINCDNLEQYSRRNSLRIYGLNERKEEDLLDKLPDFLNKELNIEPPLLPQEICRAHRIGRPADDGSSRPCILKLSTYQARQKIYKKRSNLKHSASQVYINEDLTQRRSELLWKACQLKKQRKIQDTWSYDGNVLIKTLDSRIKKVSELSQLDALI